MLKKWILLTSILSLCSSGTLQANPLNSPDIVYIDGLPCNSACQSYMAWSAQALSARHRAQRGTNVVVPAEAEIERMEHAGQPRVARQPAPVSRIAPRGGVAASKTRPSKYRKGRRTQSRSSQEEYSGGQSDSGAGKARRGRRGAGAQTGKH